MISSNEVKCTCVSERKSKSSVEVKCAVWNGDEDRDCRLCVYVCCLMNKQKASVVKNAFTVITMQRDVGIFQLCFEGNVCVCGVVCVDGDTEH